MGKKELENTKHHPSWEAFHHEVGVKVARKLKARRNHNQGIWFGLGLLGLVGWSVVTPALIGVALGIWIDTRSHSRFSWTLMLLFIGLILGCWNAWHWVSTQQEIIERGKNEPKKGARK
jgi:ATP synthase protein I